MSSSSSPTKPRPHSSYQLTYPLTPTNHTFPSSDEHDGDLELRRQLAIKDKLIETNKTSLDWLWPKAGLLGNWISKQPDNHANQTFLPTSLDKECDKCARILYTFTQRGLNGTIHSPLEETMIQQVDGRKTEKVLQKIPSDIIQQAEGLAIFTVYRSGLGGDDSSSGSGVIISRDSPTTWGAPSGILIHNVDLALLAGIDVYDVVLVLRTQQAVMSFANPKVTLGAELAIVSGPIGNGVSFESSPDISPIFSYTKSKEIYGGLQLDGNIILEREDENARFYGRKVKAEQILQGGAVAVPRHASGLIAVIDAAEGNAYDPSDFPEPIDVAPSEESTGVSTIQESRMKAAEESGVAEKNEEEVTSEQPIVEEFVNRRRTMPPMYFHYSSSPSKPAPTASPPEIEEPPVEVKEEITPANVLAVINAQSTPPPPVPRRRGLTSSRPSTGQSTSPSAAPSRSFTLVPSEEIKNEPSPDPAPAPAPTPTEPKPPSRESADVPLLDNTDVDTKTPEPFQLHERVDSSTNSTGSDPKPSDNESCSSSPSFTSVVQF
ncbi:hypothetical protein MJO29_009141 [Puccinia striiformis f. sp. tritici]|nr:hypothetical protein Pst134EB_018840 [Puccinia striiformis f. sp. tritici]KAI7950467.1 hypothetical protein MJO29_009141 [Puccinia striiformis f. sp. tritici]